MTRLGTLGEMAAGIAHELNQPLTAILAQVRAAERLLDDEDERPAVRQALLAGAGQARRAADIISRMRELVKPSSPSPRRAVDPDALVLTLSPLQGQLPPGWVDTRNLVAEETVSLLQNHPNGEVLEPGVEYDDQAAFILPVGALYLAQAKLDLGDDFSSAESYVRVR